MPYWNAYVAVTQLRGVGTFFDPRLNDAVKFPVAAATGLANVRPAPGQEDLVTAKLGALQFYQLALKSPPAPGGSFDAAEAADGKASASPGSRRSRAPRRCASPSPAR